MQQERLSSLVVRRSQRRGSTRFTTLELAALALVAIAIIAAAVGPSLLGSPGSPLRTATIKVSANDTLWEIAAAHPAPGLSTAETVEAIRELNGSGSDTIVAGQTLIVPALDAMDTALAQR